MSGRRGAPDQAIRDAVIAERARNVLLDAGAGGGKTSLLVARLVDLVAPSDAACLPIAIERIAAVTFTRRAAGELALRVRQALLAVLADAAREPRRAALAADALAALDTAAIGTIHSVADRLLRRFPLEAGLSPAFTLQDDIESLVAETFAMLHDACEAGALSALVDTDVDAALVREAEDTFRAAFEARLPLEPADVTRFNAQLGLSDLLRAWIEQRDRTPAAPALPAFARAAFAGMVAQFRRGAGELAGTTPGVRWFKRMCDVLDDISLDDDAIALYAQMAHTLGRPPAYKKGDHFDNDRDAWAFYKLYTDKAKTGEESLRDRLMAPLEAEMAARLARARPVALALYERVKARHRVADQVDLLVKLRDVLRDHLDVRRALQERFAHIFVDEFQDTDPLQAEILLYLCEDGQRAREWREVRVAPGRLTVVGDPQQSIYRFRRADLRVYDAVRDVLARGDCLHATLSANFRSDPALIDWCNASFAEIFAQAESGGIAHAPMRAGRPAGGDAPRVRILTVELGAPKEPVRLTRAREAECLAATLRGLVDGGATQIADPRDGALRPMRYGDIAVLALTTTSLRLLLDAFDRAGIPFTASGGTLFTGEPLHRRFALALCALADPDDGPAMASLAQAPFSAVSLAEWAAWRAQQPSPRAAAVDAWIADLRATARTQPVGATVRALLERTACERVVATLPNGAVRLARLRDFALELEVHALRHGFDLAALAADIRPWAETPPAVTPAPLSETAAVHVLTVHQAKGLEWPVVALWDARRKLDDQPRRTAWRVTPDDRAWALSVGGLTWEEPRGGAILQFEKEQDRAERRRLLYVAVTRAREMLIVPRVGAETSLRFVPNYLLAASPPESVGEIAPLHVPAPADRQPEPRAAEEDETSHTAWRDAAARAVVPRAVPISVTAFAHRDDPPRAGRHGAWFGSVVHRAIAATFTRRAPDAVTAVARADALQQLGTVARADAAADVVRACAALQGYASLPDGGVRFEYALAGWGEAGAALLHGVADFVAVTAASIDLVDFKTDTPPDGEAFGDGYAHYVAQVREYARLLRESGVAGLRPVRAGLLFTADGMLRWIDEPAG